MNDEVVTRLYRCIVEELRQRGHSEAEPVSVSELYEEIVPYRAVRTALGVELNADYEHALLRLLAGERDLLRLDPEDARDELRREVEAPYPFVGLFRKFAGSDVRVALRDLPDPDRDAPAGGSTGTPADEEAAAASTARTSGDGPRRSLAPEPGPGPRLAAEGRGAAPVAGGGAAVPLRADAPVQLHREAEPVDPTRRLTHAGDDCSFCGDDLPPGRRVRFCPGCGGDQRLRPCPRCEAVLEREWRYCISCGHDISGS